MHIFEPWHFKIPLVLVIFPPLGLALLFYAIWRAIGGSEGLDGMAVGAARRLTAEADYQDALERSRDALDAETARHMADAQEKILGRGNMDIVFQAFRSDEQEVNQQAVGNHILETYRNRQRWTQ
ncbi:MAG: hypothetical protein M3Q39_15975 [Actinomycetota bacterium]|nr:hypothetical protein [Actinomycetota bacterium]